MSTLTAHRIGHNPSHPGKGPEATLGRNARGWLAVEFRGSCRCIGGVVVGIVDSVRGVVDFACVGESVCSMLCWGVVGEGVGFVVVSVGWLD